MFVKTDGGRSKYGFSEQRDCAVRAYAIFADAPYNEAHCLFKEHGRKDRHGTYYTTIEKVMSKFTKGESKGLTINQLRALHPVGKVYAVKRGHAFAMIDGVIHDTGMTGGKSRVIHYWYDGLVMLAPGRKANVTPDKKAEAHKIYIRLHLTGMSNYQIAKQIAADMGITVANANYYVTRVFSR